MQKVSYQNILTEAFGPDYNVYVCKLVDEDVIRVEIGYQGNQFKTHTPFSRIFKEPFLDGETEEEAKERTCKNIISVMLKACFLEPSTVMLMEFLNDTEDGKG